MKKSGISLTPEEKAENHRASMRKYYAANKGRFKKYYKMNKAERDAYDKMYRDLNRAAYLLKQKKYNDTKRTKN